MGGSTLRMRYLEKKIMKKSWLPFWCWSAFFLGFWEILLLAQNPGLMSDDSGEMIAASYNLGIAHPPAYPLLCLVGHLFSRLPLGEEAFRFNLLSALLTVFSIAFLSLSCLQWLKMQTDLPMVIQKRITTWGTLSILTTLLSCRSVFAQSLTAKGCVYTSTLFFAMIFLWLRLKYLDIGDRSNLFPLIFYLWALGMSNHWQ